MIKFRMKNLRKIFTCCTLTICTSFCSILNILPINAFSGVDGVVVDSSALTAYYFFKSLKNSDGNYIYSEILYNSASDSFNGYIQSSRYFTLKQQYSTSSNITVNIYDYITADQYTWVENSSLYGGWDFFCIVFGGSTDMSVSFSEGSISGVVPTTDLQVTVSGGVAGLHVIRANSNYKASNRTPISKITLYPYGNVYPVYMGMVSKAPQEIQNLLGVNPELQIAWNTDLIYDELTESNEYLKAVMNEIIGDTSSQQVVTKINGVNSSFDSSSSEYKEIESNLTGDLSTNLNAIDVTGQNSFISSLKNSADFVQLQIDNLFDSSPPLKSAFVVCLILGLSLLIIGKIRS